jgi:hypothetical protein
VYFFTGRKTEKKNKKAWPVPPLPRRLWDEANCLWILFQDPINTMLIFGDSNKMQKHKINKQTKTKSEYSDSLSLRVKG